MTYNAVQTNFDSEGSGGKHWTITPQNVASAAEESSATSRTKALFFGKGGGRFHRQIQTDGLAFPGAPPDAETHPAAGTGPPNTRGAKSPTTWGFLLKR